MKLLNFVKLINNQGGHCAAMSFLICNHSNLALKWSYKKAGGS